MSNILITGSSSGLGHALMTTLSLNRHKIFCVDKIIGDDILTLTRSEIEKHVNDHGEGRLDVLINCAGVNKINWLENVTDLEWDEVMDVNVKGMFRMTRECLPLLLASQGTVLNIVSNAATMPMRCSAAYNASKGAALILTKQLARELTSKGVTVFSISPNKLAGTAMSNSIDEQVVKTRGWTKEQAKDYQLKGMLTGEETPVEAVSTFIKFLLDCKENHKYLSGCDIPYGA